LEQLKLTESLLCKAETEAAVIEVNWCTLSHSCSYIWPSLLIALTVVSDIL